MPIEGGLVGPPQERGAEIVAGGLTRGGCGPVHILGTCPIGSTHLRPRSAVAAHAAGPLLVVGGAGTGKTPARCALRVARAGGAARPRRSSLSRTPSAAADALRAQVEDALERGFEELARPHVAGFCARLLRDEALEAGLDPFVVPVARADRLAMLLERVDELTLRRHDFRGNPAALLGGVIARIDRLKEGWSPPTTTRAGRPTLPRRATTRAEREREFAGSTPTTTGCCAEQGALDLGDLLLRAARAAARPARTCARASRRAGATCSSTTSRTSRSRRPAARHARWRRARQPHRDGRRRPGDPALPRRGAEEPARPRRRAAPTRTVVRLERSLRCPAAVSHAAQAVVAPNPGRIAKRLEAPARRRASRFWRCANERAQAQAVAAEVERLVRARASPPSGSRVLVRSVRNEGQAVAAALEERAVPHRLAGAAAFFQRAEVRDVLAWLRLLADPGDARRRRARARPPADRAAPARPRALHADRAAAQARHGLRARRRDRVAAAPARGARAHPRLPQAPPPAAGRARHHAARPLRAPPDRAARPAPPAAVRRAGRRRRAAAWRSRASASSPRVRAPRAAGDAARVRPLVAAVAEAGLPTTRTAPRERRARAVVR